MYIQMPTSIQLITRQNYLVPQNEQQILLLFFQRLSLSQNKAPAKQNDSTTPVHFTRYLHRG